MTRHVFLALSVCAALATPVLATTNSPATELTEKELYAQAEALRLGDDTGAAFEMMTALAESGYGRAQAKLGYYYLKGIGTVPSSADAATWYQAAIAGGRDGARTSYAKLLMADGQTQAALEQLNAGAAAGIEKARSLRAVLHYEGRFGAASDRDVARSELAALAAEHDVPAMLTMLRGSLSGDAFEMTGSNLEAALISVARGNSDKRAGKAAEGLLKLWQEYPAEENQALRAEMLAHPSLRAKVWADQSLRLAYDIESDDQFRQSAVHIVGQVPEDQRGRAFYLVSRLDKNAFVHVLQERLRDRGYYRGRTNGYLTQRTIQALARFCQDAGIQDTCRLGPLRSNVIKVVAAELVSAQ
ncbi:peptidoglycan-binding domain-containing protein [Shimia sagamensis]|uniref:Peptidoglycan binding domain-containing protein n=1 Tax=Shimia sagamensis TaxID=1566352 RepID=A0ABY1P5X3_9RHOB|nr:peptidoglycan-binding domain-containing protein [Shimia sagamensis]SMP27242.1 Putative peptidoglycan binding domain-containing protein [Shimia sagamensis]